MDHTEAVRLMAAERYLLDDLTAELQEGFEEHYFECQECALDVRAGNAFIGYAKLELAAKPEAKPAAAVLETKSRGWMNWWRPLLVPGIAALALVLFFYQNLVTVPQLKSGIAAAHAPQLWAPLYLTAGQGRGPGGVPVATTKRNQPVPLSFDIPGDGRFVSYVCEIYSPTGALEGSVTVPAEAAKNAVYMSMYPKLGQSGVFQLVKRGIVPGSGTTQSVEIERQSFEVQIQD
jgi:hypothetical protein